MSSISPTSQVAMTLPGAGDVRSSHDGSDSGHSKSPLANFSFLRGFADKKTTRDGQPPKRRGPKPDSKPALTRRQELNRQAQRTHRERKEMYIKALEQEVLRLKEVFTNTAKERDMYCEENRRLKELLAAHGIAFDMSPGGVPSFGRMDGSTYGGSSTGSVSGSYNAGTASTGITSPPRFPSGSAPQPTPPGVQQQQHQPQQPQNAGLDYDQIGIDFVLTLERPCMDHMQMLLVRANDSDADVSGHALMATCPPESHIHNHPEEKYPHKMPDIGMPDLMKLLDLSNRLPLDGEITPVMAWAIILQHERFKEITAADFESMKTDLLAKVRCYGFGAVLEEFEVRDALSSVFALKGERMAGY